MDMSTDTNNQGPLNQIIDNNIIESNRNISSTIPKKEFLNIEQNDEKRRESLRRKSTLENLPKINQKVCYNSADWKIPLDSLPNLERQVFQEKYYPF